MSLEDARLVGHAVPAVPLTQRSRLDARSIGAAPAGEDCSFRVWAPRAATVEVEIVAPIARVAKLRRMGDGWHEGILPGIGSGARYFYRLDAKPRRPDPASRFQPLGVHGPSEVVDPHRFTWRDSAWKGVPLESSVFYEIHVGTFSQDGTFAGAIRHLDELRDLGVTTVELMPVAEFPGSRNWGYDGVQPFAVHSAYGGPAGLQRFVDECHARGLAVALDVVYNHLGPEGNYLDEFGPYFTERYKTPWGRAINFDGPDSDGVRAYFVRSALWWITELHVDVLRIDAIHGIVDATAVPFLAELTDAVHARAAELGREIHVVGESDLNDVRVLRPTNEGGFGFDAQWNDDFHHALHSLLTGERAGYYSDFGTMSHLRKAYERAFVLSGEYSQHRRRRHGSDASEVSPRRLVVFAQNHDQIGNRMFGERLASLVSFEALKLAAGAVLLSPYVPLLFMGEEWGETAPFFYFTSHSDPALIEAVRQGRREEFATFWDQGHPPDPHDEPTFARSRLNRGLLTETRGRRLRELYTELLRLRRDVPALARSTREGVRVGVGAGETRRVLWLQMTAADLAGSSDGSKGSGASEGPASSRGSGTPENSETPEDSGTPEYSGAPENGEVIAIFNFGGDEARPVDVPFGSRRWTKLLESADRKWGGRGAVAPATLEVGARAMRLAPNSFVLYA